MKLADFTGTLKKHARVSFDGPGRRTLVMSWGEFAYTVGEYLPRILLAEEEVRYGLQLDRAIKQDSDQSGRVLIAGGVRWLLVLRHDVLEVATEIEASDTCRFKMVHLPLRELVSVEVERTWGPAPVQSTTLRWRDEERGLVTIDSSAVSACAFPMEAVAEFVAAVQEACEAAR